MSAPPLDALLVAKRDVLRALVLREAGALLRYQTADDLVQAVHVHVLERRAQFDYRGDDAFVGWLSTLARNVLHDRRDYWTALKRRSGRLLRYTAGPTADGDVGVVAEPAAEQPGPSTFASRREQLVLATRALDILLPRDRDLVTWDSEGVPLAEQAERLELRYDALVQARKRAFDRFRKAYELVSRR